MCPAAAIVKLDDDVATIVIAVEDRAKNVVQVDDRPRDTYVRKPAMGIRRAATVS